MLVKSGHHQASVQGKDEGKHSHWQPPTSESQQDKAHQQPCLQQDISYPQNRPSTF